MGYTTRLLCPMYEIARYAGTSNIYLYLNEIRSDTLVFKLKNKVLAAYSNHNGLKKIRQLSMKYNKEKNTAM